jgi:Fe-S-cluster containining protein
MDFKKECSRCKRDAHCCVFKKNKDGVAGFVFIDLKDAATIKKKTGKKYSEFLDFSPLSSKIVSEMKSGDPSLEGAMRYALLDKKSKDCKNRLLRLNVQKNGNCIFLNSEGLCDIYDVRPKICRIYPFWAMTLIDGKLKVIRHEPYSKCRVIKALQGKSGENTDLETLIPKKETSRIKKAIIDVNKDNVHYKEHIDEFKDRMMRNARKRSIKPENL